MQTSGQEAAVTHKRSAETDAEHLEEGAAETVEVDSDKRIALKRKAEGDPSESEMEDSVMNSLAESWHREDDPTVKLICSSFSSVIAALQACMRLAPTSQRVKSPGHCSRTMSADGITSMTRVASCSTTPLSRRQEPRKSASSWNSG